MAVIELVTEPYEPKPASTRTRASSAAPAPSGPPEADTETQQAEVADDPVEARAEEAGVAPFAEVGDDAAFEETQGGVEGKWPGSHVPLEDADEAPEGYPVKGNEGSMKYHEPDGQWYAQTTAEVWFDSAESAEAAGFTKAGE